ncbi:MAG: aldo/keto reductase [Alphaproteobacteria bacterium]|nr:aldo/keto reductase [Alphaproteobacteria bacterium]|tara:strand:+ start:1250 stop:2293 length:1044 start_codon:yes stop_codon:yes gene_type:complete
MIATERTMIGATDVAVTQFGFGGVFIGDPDEITTDEQAQATLAAVYDGGVRYFDTAPWYGNTKSEHRLGQFLRNKPRNEFVISTKVGRVYSRPANEAEYRANSPWAKRWLGGLPFDLRFDYTYDGVMRSYEDSLARLGLARVDCLAIHDLDPRHQKSEEGVVEALRQLDRGRGFAALAELKAQGEIKAIGAGVNEVGMIPRFIQQFDVDYFLLASPYNLLEQTALDQDLPLCLEHGIGVVLGAVFASGILASGPRAGAKFRYQPADEGVLARVRRIIEICERHSVSLRAAAMQFPLHHEAVNCIIPGANHPDQITANLKAFASPIPEQFWREMKQQGCLPNEAPTAG